MGCIETPNNDDIDKVNEINSNMGCIETIWYSLRYRLFLRLIVIWDVLKLCMNGKTICSPRLIVIWDVLKPKCGQHIFRR